MAEDRQTSHVRSSLNHFRLPIKRKSGLLAHNDLANHGTKRLRPLLLAAMILLSIIILSLHAVGGIVLLKTGFGAFSLHNPIAYLLIGLSLIIALFKLNHVVGFMRRRKR
ncbi:MAG TPA: hypothetical protein VFU22_19305 [Roseiflexaceae bacterium]|nr:hypothetical protein [Roseiflexaceae bacterium]